MDTSVRERMIESAIVLLAQSGYQATSFGAVLERSRTPRGSIYHHFPGGKDQLIAAAVERAGDRAVALMDSMAGASATEVVDGFVALWRAVLERSGFTAGCSVLAVTVSSESADLLDRSRTVFAAWAGSISALLRTAGLEQTRADSVATLLIAATEGAVVLCRAQQSLDPLDAVHQELRRAVAAPPAAPTATTTTTTNVPS